jgi:hypothetical protein
MIMIVFAILVYLSSLGLTTTVFEISGPDQDLFSGVDFVNFEIKRNCTILFIKGNSEEITFDVGNSRLTDGRNLNYTVNIDFVPLRSCAVNITSRDYSRRRYSFTCYRNCDFKNEPNSWGSEIRLSIRANSANIDLVNFNLPQLFINSEGGSLSLRNTSITNSLLLLKNSEIRIISDFTSDLIVHQISSSMYFFSDSRVNKDASLEVNYCILYGNCTTSYVPLSFPDEVLTPNDQYLLTDAYFSNARNKNIFEHEDHYINFYYKSESPNRVDRNHILLDKSNIMIVNSKTYHSKSFFWMNQFSNFLLKSQYTFPYKIMNVNHLNHTTFALNDTIVFTNSLALPHKEYLQSIYDISFNYFKNSFQTNILFLKFLSFGIDAIIIRKPSSEVIIADIDFLKESFTGENENRNVTLPIVLSSFTMLNEFFNLLVFVNKTRENFNNKDLPRNYEALIQIKNPEVFTTMNKLIQIPSSMILTEEQMMSRYFQIKWNIEGNLILWPVVNNHISDFQLFSYWLAIFFSIVFFLSMIFLHITFLSSSIDYYNIRKEVYNKKYNANLKLDILSSNFFYKWLTLIFAVDYNQVASYYFNNWIGKYENSVSVFYKLGFKKVQVISEERPLKPAPVVKFKDFVNIYKDFCFFNDLHIHNIESFISEAKLKDFNHKIFSKESDELYIKDFQVMIGAGLSASISDNSNYGDSLDMFICQKCSFFSNKSTRLTKLTEAYNSFCKINNLFAIKFNEDYLRLRYQMRISKKSNSYIKQDVAHPDSNYSFILNSKYFTRSDNSNNNQEQLLNSFNKFVSFSYELKKLGVGLIVDFFSFQNLMFIIVLPAFPNSSFLMLMFHLVTILQPKFMDNTLATTVFFGFLFIQTILRAMKKTSIMNSSLIVSNIFVILLNIITWVYIYYQKFIQIYYIIFYLVRSVRMIATYGFQLNFNEIDMFLHFIVIVVFIFYIILLVRKYRLLKESSLKDYRMQIMASCKINFPNTNLQRISAEEKFQTVQKLVNQLNVVKKIMHSKESLKPEQFEALMQGFFQELNLAKNDDLMKLVFTLSKRVISIKELTESLIKLSIKQKIFSVFKCQENTLMYKEQVEIIESLLLEIILMRINVENNLTWNLLKIFDKLFKTSFFTVNNREFQKLFDVFLSKKVLEDEEGYRADSISEMKNFDILLFEMMRPLIRSPGSFNKIEESNSKISNESSRKELLLKKILLLDSNSYFNMIFSLKALNLQDTAFGFSFHRNSNYVAQLEKFINTERVDDKSKIKHETMQFIFHLKHLKTNLFNDLLIRVFQKRSQVDPETDLRICMFLFLSLESKDLFQIIEMQEVSITTNSIVQFFCRKFAMECRELLGMIYFLNRVHSPYNYNFICFLCRSYNFNKMISFCTFAYSLLNYQDPSDLYWLRIYLPSELIELFLYLKKEISIINDESINNIIKKLDISEKSKIDRLQLLIRERSIDKLSQFLIENTAQVAAKKFNTGLIDIIVDVISMKSDASFIFEKLTNSFAKFIQDKRFLVFFKQLFEYSNEIRICNTGMGRNRKYSGAKFEFIFPKLNGFQSFFQFITNPEVFSNQEIAKIILPQIYQSNTYSSNLISIMGKLATEIRKEASTILNLLNFVQNFKSILKKEIIVPSGKLLGCFFDRLVTNKTKFSFDETNDIIDSTFSTFFKFESLESFKNSKFNEFIVCLYKSLLLHNPLYLGNFFSKFHSRCETMQVLVQKFFGASDLCLEDVYKKIMQSLIGFSKEQLSIVELYFSLNYGYTSLTDNIKLLHRNLHFHSEFCDLLDIYQGRSFKWIYVLECISKNMTTSSREDHERNLKYINSFLLRTIFSVFQPSDLYGDNKMQASELQIKIKDLRILRKKLFENNKIVSQRKITAIIESDEFEPMMSMLGIIKSELILFLSIITHQFGEAEIISLFIKLRIPLEDQKLLANILLMKKNMPVTKENCSWDISLLNSGFFNSIQKNPFISWVITYGIKGDFYSMIKTLKSRLRIMQGDKYLLDLIYFIFYIVFDEQEQLIKSDMLDKRLTSDQKLVNCRYYYHCKLQKKSQITLEWLLTKVKVRQNLRTIQESDNNIVPLVIYLQFVFNLEQFRTDKKFEISLRLLTFILRTSMRRILKKRFIGNGNLEKMRIKKSLNQETNNLTASFDETISKEVVFDIENQEFIRFCEKEFHLLLSTMNLKNINRSVNKALIKLFVKRLKKQHPGAILISHLDSCLQNPQYCCWSHSLLKMSHNCVINLFISEVYYKAFCSDYFFLMIKMFGLMGNLRISNNGLELSEEKNEPNRCFQDQFIIQTCIQILVKHLIWSASKNKNVKNYNTGGQFDSLNKMLIIALDLKSFCSENKLLSNVQKNLLAKIVELSFGKLSQRNNILNENEKLVTKVLNEGLKIKSKNLETLASYFTYLRTFLPIRTELLDNNYPSQTLKKQKFNRLSDVIDSELESSKYSKVAAKVFINQSSFAFGCVELHKKLYSYQRSYIQEEFTDFPLATQMFPQKYLDIILLFLNFEETVSNIEKSILKSMIKLNFKSNPKNLIDLVQFLISGYKKIMFQQYIGASEEARILCSTILNEKFDHADWLRYSYEKFGVSEEFSDVVVTIINNIDDLDIFANFERLGMSFYAGKHFDQARQYLKLLFELMKGNHLGEKSKSKALISKISTYDYLKDGEIDQVNSLINIIEAVNESNFSFFSRPDKNYLKVFFENLKFENVEILRVFALIEAIKSETISMEETESVLYQFISFSQYDLTNIDLTEARHLLAVLKNLFTGNHLQMLELLKSPLFKKQHAFYLSFYIYLEKASINFLFSERSDWETLYSSSRDYIFIQLLKTNLSSEDRMNEDDHNLSLIINNQQFLQEILYKFDDKKLKAAKLNLREKKSHRLVKIEPTDILKCPPSLNIATFSNEIRRLYYFFIDAEQFYTENNNLSESQKEKLLSLNHIVGCKEEDYLKPDKEIQRHLQILFGQNSQKSELIIKCLTSEEIIISSAKDKSLAPLFQMQNYFKLMKELSTLLISMDHSRPVRIFQRFLPILYDCDLNSQVSQLISLLCKIGVFEADAKSSLLKNFSQLNLNTIFEFVNRLTTFNERNSAYKQTLMYYLSVIFSELEIPQTDQMYFFYIDSVFSKEESLVRHWFANKTANIEVFEELQNQYQKLINAKKPSLNAIAFVRKENELKELQALRVSLGSGIFEEQRLFNIFVFRLIECVNQRGNQEIDIVKFILTILHSHNEAENFYVDIFFTLYKHEYNSKKLTISKDSFGSLNSKLTSLIFEQQIVASPRFLLFRPITVFKNSIIFIFSCFFYVTSRLANYVPGSNIDPLIEQFAPRLIFCILISCAHSHDDLANRIRPHLART